MDDQTNKAGRILVIDDEESLRLTFEMFLKRAGYGAVIGVSTFEAAIAAIQREDFDLIISDIVLEGTSGIDILRHVREHGKKTPVVLVTGYPNIDTAVEAVRLGAFDYVPKPVKKNALLEVVGKAMAQRKLQQEKERFLIEKEKHRYTQETILRSVREIIITVDPGFKIIDLNDMALEWTKSFLPAIKVGVLLTDLTGPVGDALSKFSEVVRKTRQEVSEQRIEWQRSDGGEGVLSMTAAALKDESNNFLGVVLSARDVTYLETPVAQDTDAIFHSMIGQSPAMQRIYTLIKNVGQVDTTVLITGESGTGKELVVEALHAESPRCNGPLIKVDCTAIPENLLESELFGHQKGSFTGASRDREGRILQADGGTIFLDEIGDISPTMQLRFLRFLQERTFYPVGRDQPVHVDVRVIAATNADLKQKVRDELFREDLYFRLRVVDIILPALREREDDIILLANNFLKRFAKQHGKPINGFSDQAIECLRKYSWPGNVRELEHVVERAAVLCKSGTIITEHLPVDIVLQAPTAAPQIGSATFPQSPSNFFQDAEPSSEVEKIIRALKQAGGNKAKAARLLGVDRSTLYRKIVQYNLDLSTMEF